jgi:hypothetical protein
VGLGLCLWSVVIGSDKLPPIRVSAAAAESYANNFLVLQLFLLSLLGFLR